MIDYLFRHLLFVSPVVPDIFHIIKVVGAIVIETTHVTLIQFIQHVFSQRSRALLFGVFLSIYQLQTKTKFDDPEEFSQNSNPLMLTTVTPKIITNKREANPITITAMAHWGNNTSFSA